MTLNELKQALDIIYKDAPDGEIGGNVYGYHDEVQIYPEVDFTEEQAEALYKLGWMPTDEDEDSSDNGLMHFT